MVRPERVERHPGRGRPRWRRPAVAADPSGQTTYRTTVLPFASFVPDFGSVSQATDPLR